MPHFTTSYSLLERANCPTYSTSNSKQTRTLLPEVHVTPKKPAQPSNLQNLLWKKRKKIHKICSPAIVGQIPSLCHYNEAVNSPSLDTLPPFLQPRSLSLHLSRRYFPRNLLQSWHSHLKVRFRRYILAAVKHGFGSLPLTKSPSWKCKCTSIRLCNVKGLPEVSGTATHGKLHACQWRRALVTMNRWIGRC